MTRPPGFFASTVGKKIVMAVSGLIMVGFVILHMAGNLQIFEGANKLNTYSAFLHGPANEVLWVLRAILLISVIAHIISAYQLTMLDRAARPVPYAKRELQAATIASRTMRVGGVLLAIFIVLHILHFTTLTLQPAALVQGDVYANAIASFRIWWVTLAYVIAMIFLGLHLYHGLWSSVRTLGFERGRLDPFKRPVAMALAIILWAGFTIVPVAVYFHLVQ
ncbi:MAG TPA: succinate dehydrogenase cytochrome b subunit [Gemmatimonadaceae bacterium]|nr:succinate dehydrogenase cytochrome b subunit [Gemmatimonadaceae bacterium]